jgi:hypothetical protein
MGSDNPFVLLLQPHQADSQRALDIVRSATVREYPGATVEAIDHLQDVYRPAPEAIIEAVSGADVVIGNMDGGNLSVTFGLGVALSMSKPILLIAPAGRAISVPFDLASYRLSIFSYDDPTLFVESFGPQLRGVFERQQGAASTSVSSSVFISYNHNDTEYLQRLLVHLRPLERANLIDPWADTRLRPGDRWESAISQALSRASASILLISADYMASEFIVANELPPLLAKAEAGGTRIIPVILKPCRFTRDKHLSRFQAVNDPRRPLIAMPEAEKEEIFDRVAMTVENLVRGP